LGAIEWLLDKDMIVEISTISEYQLAITQKGHAAIISNPITQPS